MKDVKKFDVAILGIGGMGGTHTVAAKDSPYVRKIYGTDITPERTRLRAKELGIIPATLEEILNNPEIRLVCIAASNDAHVPLAKAALRAGKAVMCEKPMGDTLEEAKSLIDVYKETGGFLQIGFELHYSKLYRTVKEWIDEGKIGDPVNIQCRYYCCEFHRNNTWRCKGTGCFLIGEKLSHYLDLERWWFHKKAETVYAAAAPKVVSYFHHEDNHTIVTKYEDGKLGTLNFIMYAAESYHEDPLRELLEKQADDGHFLQYHICGTKGAIETDVFRRRLRRWEFSDAADGLESTIVETICWKKEDDNRMFHDTHDQNLRIIELVAQGLPPEVSPEDAYETMKLCFGAEKSTYSGEVVRLSDL